MMVLKNDFFKKPKHFESSDIVLSTITFMFPCKSFDQALHSDYADYYLRFNMLSQGSYVCRQRRNNA
jgi:hypothetical protein